MTFHNRHAFSLPENLPDALRSFPRERQVEHCGTVWSVSPFDIYVTCPQCGTRLKLRSFAAVPEIEDVFDAVFEWMNQPGAEGLASDRRAAIARDAEE